MEDDLIQFDMPTIPEFFKGRSIFITGATGFMGKVLVEKLLRSCPELDTIYLLLRPKKGHSVEERLDEFRNSQVFARLNEERPGASMGTQLVAVAGDVSEKGFGLSEQDRDTLVRHVSVFFHSAASVRFDDPIKKAVSLNLRGTYEAVQLAEQMQHLVVFLYVSTTYSNTTRFVTDEAVYPPAADWRLLLRMIDELDDDTLEIVTPKILGKLPNTYGFSKGLAESVVNDHRDTVPAIIFRPSIVCSSVQEPFPGWLDNLNGPAGLLIACGKGLIHSVFCNMDLISDFSPVDVAIKAMIVAAWKNGVRRSRAMQKEGSSSEPKSELITEDADDGRCSTTIPVYNCATSPVRNTTIGTVVTMAQELASEIPLNDCIWYPTGNTTTNRFRHTIVVFLMQILPACIIDGLLKIKGEKTRLLRMQRRIFLACHALEYYLNNAWSFPNNRFQRLLEEIPDCDKETFGSTIWEVDEREYFINCMRGARKYLLNEPEDTMPAAKRHIVKMYWLDKIVRYGLLALIVYALFSIFFGPSNIPNLPH
ncbi:putative fatty acyl-CoA reductase CG5065 [Neocloeon triangulifer]|uniref:putative fatty acyl-CoA reductase CG5065 n=1 Tax=Neocloeon triangulifer TaxID=2078957 RepID=UPI00286EEFC5|nr:putative fatty acyl-CoA reductase CG5065 [Neocloeon triangulifer]